MDYKGYSVIEEKNRIIVRDIKDFDPVHILECGQCFRWLRQKDSSYIGVVGEKAVRLQYEDESLIIYNSTAEDFANLWYVYFDLGRDYGAVKEILKKDEIMEEAIKFGFGIRILKQNIWEMLISFIISANNMIPRIMKTVEAISKDYGKKIYLDSKEYYTFPDADILKGIGIEELEGCSKAGFRCKYIAKTSKDVADGLIKLSELEGLTTDEARKSLMRLSGVGPKVSDCVLLYSGTKHDAFPTDVWVKRVMEELYFKREASFKEIQDFAASYFGELAGFAQQYLFYYARENKIGAAAKEQGK